MPKFNRLFFAKILKNSIYFIISKGAAFLAPILFLKFVTLSQYGVVEYSYSMGSVLAILACIGLNGAYPYFILKKKDETKIQSFLFYGLLASLVAVISFLLYYCNLTTNTTHFVILFTMVFAIQRLLSSKLKSEDFGYLAVIVDSGYYYILSLVIIMVWCFNIRYPMELLLHTMEIYLLGLCVYTILKFFHYKTFSFRTIVKQELPVVLKFSYKLIISGFIVFWLTASARIYINWFLGSEAVGLWSYYYRIAGASVLIYMFIYIAFFKKIYTIEPKKMDMYFTLIMLLVAVGSVSCALVIPFASKFLNLPVKLDDWALYYMMSIQMPIWAGFALCESIIGRENIVGKFNIRMMITALLFPLLLLLIKGKLNLFVYAYLCVILFFISLLTQQYLLARKGIVLKKCIVFNIALIIIASIYFCRNL